MSFFDDIPANWALAPRSFVGGIAWLRLPSPKIANLVQLCEVLHRTQHNTPDMIVRRQLMQARLILRFAQQQSGHYRAALADIDVDAACQSMEAWRSTVPLLSRHAIQTAGESLFSEKLPVDHRLTGQSQTSGSTGQPVTVKKTSVSGLFYHALEVREELWHRRDLSGKMATIRANASLEENATWQGSIASLYSTGPSLSSPFGNVIEQLSWLGAARPAYLVTYPSNLQALLNATEDSETFADNLIEVRTIGETLTPELRERAETRWGVKVTDRYSSEEVGNITLQCPHSSLYHTMDENLIVEILRDDGGPCLPGEVGRVVVTDLHNYATPLIRYDIRDYAEVGEPCACGRGLGTLNRVLGRHRNMLKTPEGQVRWPLTGFHSFQDVVTVRQYQFIQQELDLVEATLVVDEPLSDEQRTALESIIRAAMQWDHRLDLIERREPLDVTPNGKHEDFISRV